jgi:hypothetical protein
MAERVPIWYDVHRHRSTSAEPYQRLENTAGELHKELSLSIAIATQDDNDEIQCVAGSGPSAPVVGTKLNLDHGICAACVRQNRLQLSNDTSMDPMLSGELCARLGIRSVLSVPLRRDSTCVGFIAAFSDVPHRFDLSLIERIRNEAARIEQLLNGHTGAEPSASFPRFPRDFDFHDGREAQSLASVDAVLTSENQRHVISAFFAYSRPASIAVLSCCAIAMVAIVPRVVRSKTSIPHHAVAETSQTSTHVLHRAAANVADGRDTDDAKLRDLHQQAETGDISAQIALAARYEKNDGLERDPLKACVWYIIAGANGDQAAKDRAVLLSHRLPQFQIAEIRFNVGKMYMQGSGVKRDLVAAYSWFALAQAAGDVRARDEQERLEALMRREEVSEGLRRASDWLLAHRTAGGQHTRELAAIPQASRSAR